MPAGEYPITGNVVLPTFTADSHPDVVRISNTTDAMDFKPVFGGPATLELEDEVRQLREEVQELRGLIRLIFGHQILVDGRWIDMSRKGEKG
jgi:hypothetical protein